jgi:hypothetical protein
MGRPLSKVSLSRRIIKFMEGCKTPVDIAELEFEFPHKSLNEVLLAMCNLGMIELNSVGIGTPERISRKELKKRIEGELNRPSSSESEEVFAKLEKNADDLISIYNDIWEIAFSYKPRRPPIRLEMVVDEPKVKPIHAKDEQLPPPVPKKPLPVVGWIETRQKDGVKKPSPPVHLEMTKEMVRCDVFDAKLHKNTCASRWAEAQKNKSKRPINRSWGNLSKCANCKIGKENHKGES